MNRNTRTLVVLLVAVAAAAAATLLVYQAIQRRPVQQVALPQTLRRRCGQGAADRRANRRD